MQYVPNPIPLPGQIFMAADGEDRKAASTNVADCTMLDAIAWLSKLVGEGWYHVPLAPTANDNGRFIFKSTLAGWEQDVVTDQGGLWFYLKLPPIGKLTQLEALVDGNAGSGSGSHSGLPQNKPDLTVWRADEGDLIQHQLTQIGTQADTSSDGTAYDNLHKITLTLGTPETLAEAKAFIIRFRGESGTNSLANELLLIDLRYRVEKAP